ncbi:amidohydrolase family protein [Maribacter litopenaei]|uniref:Amidohydrolase family protein n=1 Tax=Maribacter litopenaei TaxID=2976127 RepID=A0ABY5Y4D4_9FLAO|nr:amidohydrolase family protein [Maribacter litopenaei]UWX53718.1 amidohydrolase family protein [Maribacter litopenaei]
MKTILYLFSFILVFTSCNNTGQNRPKQDILISNISILDVADGSILENRYVAIDSGRITSISQKALDTTLFETVIQGDGKFLMPGLAEMHAHIPPPESGEERIKETLFLYLSNGITTIRGMLGNPIHLELRENAANGSLLSPVIYTSSPSLNGNSVTTKEEAIEKVTQYQKDGYDFLKIHPGIQKEVFDQVVATAKEVGIPFSGHVPVDVGIRHALESQYASIDHVDGFTEGLVPASANVEPNENGFFGYAFTPLADTTQIDDLVSLSKKNKVWIVPTQSLFERWFAPISADELLSQPEMKYMNQSTLDNWRNTKNSYMEDDSFTEAQWQQFDAIRKKLIKKLQDNGQGILLGSDAPQLFNVPGFSIQHEMAGMLRAGMTPMEIIQSGTINPATFFNAENEYGQVKEGLSADLILLNDNPIKDLAALQENEGVIVRGQYLSKEMIQEKLNEIAEHAAQN